MKNKLIEIFSVVGLAAFGGVANTLAGKPRHEPYNWKIALPEIVIAIFSGLMVHYILLELNVSPNVRTVAVALAGYSARGVLAVLHKTVLQHMTGGKAPMILLLAAVLLFGTFGCQTHREYYEPSDVNMIEIGGRKYGPVKSETTGVPAWSEGKRLDVSAAGF